MKLLLLGASGLVGSESLKLALADDRFSQVIAPTRTPLSPSEKLINPVAPHLETLTSTLSSYQPDAVVCALGTTMKKAGSKEAFRYVDYDLPIAFAKAAHAAGVPTFAVVSAMGTSETSRSFYYRTKADVERELKSIGFRSLIIGRPSLIGGEREETRPAEHAALAVFRLLAPVLPKRLRINPADAIAACLLNAVATAKPGCHTINADEIR